MLHLRYARALVVVGTLCAATACKQSATDATSVLPVAWQAAKAPVAKVEAKTLTAHGSTRTDNYYWLRDDARKDSNVLAYLRAENAYTDTLMASTTALQDTLVNELRRRDKQTDNSAPYMEKGYWYYTRVVEGKNYPIYCRKKGSMDAPEEVILDVNAEAEGKAFLSARVVEVSDNGKLAIIASNETGDDVYAIRIRDIAKGTYLNDRIPASAYGQAAWAADNQTIFYAVPDQTQRSAEIRRHKLGTAVTADASVYLEKDSTFNVGLGRSKGGNYIILGSGSTVSDEYHFIPANNPTAKPTLVAARQKDLLYDVDEADDTLFIRTNWDAKNFRLMTAHVSKPGKNNWKERVAHRPDVLLSGVSLFKGHLVLSERRKGLTALHVIDRKTSADHYLDYPDPAYVVSMAANPDYDITRIRYNYQSLTRPRSTYFYDLATRKSELQKQQEIPDASFKTDNYESQRVWAKAADGTEVPISLVYRKDKFRKGQNPLYVYGYGSYGANTEPGFSTGYLSLLDRGVVVALIHVRGGQEMGRQWYEDGKLMKKKNTFTDFISGTQHLVAEGFGKPGHVVAFGGSAGGLLMGAISNMAPQGLYAGIVAGVPFVDVITTMSDPSIPLTTGEWDEWGNPITSKEAYDYMLSYSPYDQVTDKAYPHLLVVTSLNDSRVAYWEPAKWVAKLRTLQNNPNGVLLRTYMDAGHGGGSGRERAYKESAFRMAFMLKVLGLAATPQVEG